ncbi:MerR family transcriptional regulator [Nocardia sp. NPDC005978]|uniref:MerR family transcriptional regulator n=1 Tax=unclassified Nocardia TaxID=2637762 RepID=UPI0033B24CD2
MPDDPHPSSEHAGYPVRTVAERLGIPTATLRSWNRRYRIGPEQDRPGRHRLYTEADIAVLARMVELVRAGATPAGAASAARGPALTLGDRAALLTAAFALESRSVCAMLETHIRDYGVIDTWDRLCRPAFGDIVARQLHGEGCVDVEHLLSWCVIATLHRAAPPPDSPPAPLVLACTGGETHSLPIEVLRAALAERGVGAYMLGPDVPAAALRDTLHRLPSPARVLLWSHQPATALVSAVHACHRADATVYVAGPGWDALALPEPAVCIDTLAEAVERLS